MMMRRLLSHDGCDGDEYDYFGSYRCYSCRCDWSWKGSDDDVGKMVMMMMRSHCCCYYF